ncbi:polysaccharide pyruvyl transferase family protein [Cellulomonas sp. URHB0016]
MCDAPAPALRVFAPGAYTWGNKGDALLVQAHIEWLRSTMGASTVALTSYTPLVDAEQLDVPVLPMLLDPTSTLARGSARVAGRSPVLRRGLTAYRLASTRVVEVAVRWWARLYLRRPALACRLVPAKVRSLAEAVTSADLTVTVPGGYLMAPREADDTWLFHLPTLVLADALGSPVVLGPCSVGPFAGRHLGAARRFLRLPRLVLVREARSAATLRELGVEPARIRAMPDLGFASAPGPLSELGAAELGRVEALGRDGTGLVGVSVRQHTFPGSAAPARDMETYLAAVLGAVADLHAHEGAAVVVVPQTTMDGPVSLRLARDLARAGVPHLVVDPGVSPADLSRIYARLDLLVGTRMHANILAICAGTPVVAIAYQPKTAGILEELGLADWWLPIEELADGRLLRQVRTAWAERRARGHVATRRAADAARRVRAAGAEVAALARSAP